MRQVRRTVVSLLVLGLVVTAASLLRGQQPDTASLVAPNVVRDLLERGDPLEFVPGEIIVRHREVTAPIPEAALTPMGLESPVRPLSGGDTLYRITPASIAGLTPEAAQDRTLAVVESLQVRPDVEYAQPNYILQIAAAPNDPLLERQWHYRDNGTAPGRSPGGMSARKAWETGTGDPSVVVAVIDTGILPDHEDIAGSPNLVPGYDMISDTRRANDGDGRDDDPADPGDAVAANECGVGSPARTNSWHGTHVAGTVGVVRTDNGIGIAGVSWNAGVQAVRVLGKCGGTTADINDAIRWAAGLTVPDVPANANPAKVINLSLSGPAPCSMSPSTQAAIDDVMAAGVTVVVAAGNDAIDASGAFPASCNQVITVAASDARGHLVTRYSNYGSTVEILAPGGDVQRDDDDDGNPDGVYSTVSGGYAYYNGTSMAAPHVAGVAALLLAREELSPAEVSQRLQETALPRSSSQCPQPCGAGLLSAATVRSLLLSPAKIDLNNAGEQKALQATLLEGGRPVAGETIQFRSADPSVATVDPASGTTDPEGRASTTVTAQANGETSVSSTAGDVSRQTPVKVPVLSGAFALLLLALLYGAALRLTRRPPRR